MLVAIFTRYSIFFEHTLVCFTLYYLYLLPGAWCAHPAHLASLSATWPSPCLARSHATPGPAAHSKVAHNDVNHLLLANSSGVGESRPRAKALARHIVPPLKHMYQKCRFAQDDVISWRKCSTQQPCIQPCDWLPAGLKWLKPGASLAHNPVHECQRH